MTVPGVPREPSSSRPLPNGWRWVRLGDVCHEDRHLVEPGSNDAAELTCYGLEHVEAETGCILKRSRGQVEDEGKSATFRFDGRHVLYGKLRPYLNKVALPYSPGRCTTEMIPLLPHDGVDREFLAWLLRRRDTVDFAMLGKTGSRMPRADMGSLMNLVVPLPPADQQGRIAVLLREQMAAVERARAAAAARLDAISDLRLVYYREAFGWLPPFVASSVTPTNSTRPGWRWNRLTELARLATGHTPSRYQQEYWGGEIPWLQLADIRDLDGHVVHDTSEHTNLLGIHNSSAVLLPKNTVCMSRTASVGFVTIMGREMATSQDFVNWVCGPQLDPLFLMHLLIACRNSIRALGSGAVHQTVYFPTVRAFSVCVPPEPEQRQLAVSLHKNLQAVDRARAAAEAELNTINALPAALLRRAFSGEI